MMTSAPFYSRSTFQQYPQVEELQQSLMITKHVNGNKRMNTKRKDSTSERNELHDGATEQKESAFIIIIIMMKT